jgi:hypothetical protein
MSEPSNAIYFASTAAGLSVLIALYFFGVWSRSYVLPAQNDLPIRKQLIVAVPVGLITMGLYAKTAFPALLQQTQTMAFDGAVMAGYAIMFGMLSRESLDRILLSLKPRSGPSPTE